VSALAWSPDGSGLAFNLVSANDNHPHDGLWLRDSSGATRQLQTANSASPYQLHGWRPDGTELLVSNDQTELFRIDTTTGTISPIWNSGPDQHLDLAVWTRSGDEVMITSAEGGLWRVDIASTTLTQMIDPTMHGGITPIQLYDLPDGTLSILGRQIGNLYLYALSPGQSTPQEIASRGPALSGAMQWDETGTQVLIVSYLDLDPIIGKGALLATNGTLYDLMPLTGLMSQPQWGPTFTRGDHAIVNSRDPLNVRSAPGGPIMRSLVSGAPVIIIGGPRELDGYTWWQIQTPDNQTGWSVESIPADDGSRTRTLYPALN
jgi:hypothetical protein